jgi:hypothetical protein
LSDFTALVEITGSSCIGTCTECPIEPRVNFVSGRLPEPVRVFTETAQQCDRNDAVTDTSNDCEPTTDARVERIVIGAVIGFAKSAKISLNVQG